MHRYPTAFSLREKPLTWNHYQVLRQSLRLHLTAAPLFIAVIILHTPTALTFTARTWWRDYNTELSLLSNIINFRHVCVVRRVHEVLFIPLEKYLLVLVEDRYILQLIHHLKSKLKLFQRPSPCRAVNTYHLGYKKPVYVIQGCLF